jgi:hypothetical protein
MRRWDRLVETYVEEYRARGINPAMVAHTASALLMVVRSAACRDE